MVELTVRIAFKLSWGRLPEGQGSHNIHEGYIVVRAS
jgi:hypothetical protein